MREQRGDGGLRDLRDERAVERRVPRDHADVGAVALADLTDEPFVHLARTSSVRQHIDAAAWPAQTHRMMEVDQLPTVAGMVRAGLDISVAPSLTLFHFGHAELATRPLQPMLQREIYVVRPRDRSLSVAAQALYECVLEHRPRRAGAGATRISSAR